MAEQQHSGWASNDEPVVPGGPPFVSDMGPPVGVWAQEMPAKKPPVVKTRIKGVPGATSGESHDGWKDVTP